MMITLFTDPHLGTERQAHTTRESAKNLQASLYDAALTVVEESIYPTYCLGDLLDKANNSEAVVLQAYEVGSRCKSVLSGNHDETNRLGVVTTLAALAEMGVPVCQAPDLSTPFFDQDNSLYMVPHHASQEMFEQAIRDAAHHAEQTREGLASYLFLHCNYDFTLAIEDNTLNLSRELAEEVGDAFDYIFIGHEHNGGTYLDGKVVVLGNIHPTSFHDIGDKFIYELDTDTAELTKHLVWSKQKHYLQLNLNDPIPDLTDIQFIDVRGAEVVENAAEVSDYINELRKNAAEVGSCLFAVRSKVAIKDALDGVDSESEGITVEDLKSRISAELKGTELETLFNELVAEVTA